MKITSCVFVFLAFSASVATAQAPLALSAAQREVWAGEEAYCRYLINNDLHGFMSLWDDRFVGWPYERSAPATKADIREGLLQRTAQRQKFNCVSTPLAVNVIGKFANTYYVFRTKATDKSGNTVERMYRITHTWERTGGKWKIVGGMSAPHGQEHH